MRACELLVYLMDHAFDSGEFHSLMGNLSAVDETLWTSRLPQSLRTIGEIALHAGSSKVMYTDYAFGSQSLTIRRCPTCSIGYVRRTRR